MKRLLFSVVMTIFMSGAWAADSSFSYLILTDAGGTSTSFTLDNLVMTLRGGQMVVSNASGTQTFTLAQLASMHFSTTADGSTVGIGKIESTHSASLRWSEGQLYDLNGRRIQSPKANHQSKKGIYILRSPNGQTSKIVVK